jgi:hypothetical protein
MNTIVKYSATAGAVLLLLGCQSQFLRAAQPQEPPAAYGEHAQPFSSGEASPQELPGQIATEPLPLSPMAEEVIKLAHSGITDEVLLAFIATTEKPFGLTADDILYLTDLGLSDEVITAMIERDKELQDQGKVAPPRRAPAARAPVPEFSAEPAPLDAENLADRAYAPPAGGASSAQVSPPTVEVTHQHFYNTLSPYGTWHHMSDYGWVWQPTVAVVDRGWQPYFHRGRWLHTDYGWYWQSDYSWGWAPFHYGRWHAHPARGWVWVPDTVWGPSWVVWRHSDLYYGWAPLPPRTYYSGGGLYYGGSRVSVGFHFGLGHHHFAFIPASRFCAWDPWRHRIPHTKVVNVFNRTTVINHYTENKNVVINKGIPPSEVAAATRTEIRKVSVRDIPAGRDGVVRPDRLKREGNDLVVYRPQQGSISSRGRGEVTRGRELTGPESPTAGRGRGEIQKAGPGSEGLQPVLSASAMTPVTVRPQAARPGAGTHLAANGVGGMENSGENLRGRALSRSAAELSPGAKVEPGQAAGVPAVQRPIQGRTLSAQQSRGEVDAGALTARSAPQQALTQRAVPQSTAPQPPQDTIVSRGRIIQSPTQSRGFTPEPKAALESPSHMRGLATPNVEPAARGRFPAGSIAEIQQKGVESRTAPTQIRPQIATPAPGHAGSIAPQTSQPASRGSVVVPNRGGRSLEGVPQVSQPRHSVSPAYTPPATPSRSELGKFPSQPQRSFAAPPLEGSPVHRGQIQSAPSRQMNPPQFNPPSRVQVQPSRSSPSFAPSPPRHSSGGGAPAYTPSPPRHAPSAPSGYSARPSHSVPSAAPRIQSSPSSVPSRSAPQSATTSPSRGERPSHQR